MVDSTLATSYIGAANHWTGREGQSPRYVILHGTAGGSSAQGIAQYFAESSTQASAHYIIDQAGVIIQSVDESDAAWANGPVEGVPGVAAPDSENGIRDAWWTPDLNPNLITIAIEHVKDHKDNSDALTSAQRQSSFNLVKDICDRNGIPKRRADAQGGITGHFSMDAVNRSHCPSTYPWDDLFNFLGGSEGEMLSPIVVDHVSNYFEQISSQVWRCKQTGYLIGHGILTFYCAFRITPQDLGGLTHLGLPRSNEEGVLGKQGVVEQVFERGILAYDSAHIADNPPGAGAVYLAHINAALPTSATSAPTIDIGKIKAATQEILAAIGG
jgi:N-acetyl-anhydromuramyl-L-alanine amidase AmpD